MFKASIAYVKILWASVAYVKKFFSRKKYQSLIFVWKISFKYLIYKIIIKMRLLGFCAEKSH